MAEQPDVADAMKMIENAARMIALVKPGQCAAAIRAGIDASFYVDPTLGQRVLSRRDHLDKILRILDDAQRLIANWPAAGEGDAE
ncbi:MAG: hypothetical protein ACEQSH_00320 [Bacteroidia bacterium]|jgi:hypothetical protein